MNEYKKVLRKYAVFSGRASRKEFWTFALINLLILWIIGSLALGIPERFTTPKYLLVCLLVLYALAILIPTLSVSTRRLHDINRSGWWMLLHLVPYGGLVLFIFNVLDSTPGDNKYGPNPKGVAAIPAVPPSHGP